MAVRIVEVSPDSNPEILKLWFQFCQPKGSIVFERLAAFISYQKERRLLEDSETYLILESNQTFGLIELHHVCHTPVPVRKLKIYIEEQWFSNGIRLAMERWIRQFSEEVKVGHLIAYESKDFLIDFYKEMGGREANFLCFYKLTIKNLDLELLSDWDDRLLLHKYKLTLKYVNKIPEELMGQHAHIHTQLSNDIKRLNYSWQVTKSATYTRNREQLLIMEKKRAEIAYLLDHRERIVGITKLVFDPEKPDLMYQTITGVLKEYRGKGLTKLLKANMIMHIMKRYPGVRVIETDCLEGNEPMISINDKLGFHRKNVSPEVEIIL